MFEQVSISFANLLIFAELNSDQIRSDVDNLAQDESVFVVANPHRLIVIQYRHDSTSTERDFFQVKDTLRTGVNTRHHHHFGPHWSAPVDQSEYELILNTDLFFVLFILASSN